MDERLFFLVALHNERSVEMTEREVEIFEILKNNPLISQDELAEQLMISRSGVATHIHNLMKKGYIKGKGYIINQDNFVSVIGGKGIEKNS